MEQEVQGSRSALRPRSSDRSPEDPDPDRGPAERGAPGLARLDDLGREADSFRAGSTSSAAAIDTLALQFETVGPAGRRGRAAPPAPGPAPGGVAQRPATPGTQASDLYQTAYIDFTRGHYNLAIAAFREYVRLYPGTALTEKAQYWIGESHFSLARAHQAKGEAERAVQELERAVQEFRRVVIVYPRGDRVPAAIYKEALALSELGQIQLAEARLQFLADQFPSTEEAAQAKDELARIRKR